MTTILRNRANFKANVVGHVSRVISVSLKFLSLKYCCNNEQIGPNTLSYMKPCHDVECMHIYEYLMVKVTEFSTVS